MSRSRLGLGSEGLVYIPLAAGYRIHHVHRGDHTAIAGGLAVIHRDDFTVKHSTQQTRYKTFESQMVTVTNVKVDCSKCLKIMSRGLRNDTNMPWVSISSEDHLLEER